MADFLQNLPLWQQLLGLFVTLTGALGALLTAVLKYAERKADRELEQQRLELEVVSAESERKKQDADDAFTRLQAVLQTYAADRDDLIQRLAATQADVEACRAECREHMSALDDERAARRRDHERIEELERRLERLSKSQASRSGPDMA